MNILLTHSCDNCGEEKPQDDHILCEKCRDKIKRFDFICEGYTTLKKDKKELTAPFRWTVQANTEEGARTVCIADMKASGFKNTTIMKIERARLISD